MHHHHQPQQTRGDCNTTAVVSPTNSHNTIHIIRSSTLTSTEEDGKISPPQLGKRGADLRDGPVNTSVTSNSGSPLSVIEIFQQVKEVSEPSLCKPKAELPIPTIQKPQISRRNRGLDSPKKAVDTRNVYASHFSTLKADACTNHSRGSSSSSSQTFAVDHPSAKRSSLSVKASTSLQAFLDSLPPTSALETADTADPEAIDKAKESASKPLPPSTSDAAIVPATALPAGLQTPAHRPASHRRQNTNDSAHSKFAAVARGASKAAEAADDPQPIAPLVVDRPVSCPRRQQTVGSEAFPDLTDNVDHHDHSSKGPIQSVIIVPASKSPAARIVRPRPPRHDNVRVDGRATIQVMKRSVQKKNNTTCSSNEPSTCTKEQQQQQASEDDDVMTLDKPIPRPERKPTVERPQPMPVREISLTPEVLMNRFTGSSNNTKGSATEADQQEGNDKGDTDDVRDDDSLELEHEGVYFVSKASNSNTMAMPTPTTTTPHSTLHNPAIQAWLNMSQPPPTQQQQQHKKWSQSEPALPIPPNSLSYSGHPHHPTTALLRHSTTTALDNNHSEHTFGWDDGTEDKDETPVVSGDPQPETTALIVMNPSSEEDDTTTNDYSGDDRMFQAWLKMPPRVCTTHPDASIPFYTTTPSKDEADKWVATAVVPSPPHPEAAMQRPKQQPPQRQLDTILGTPRASFPMPPATPIFSIGGGCGGSTAMTPVSLHPELCLDVSAIEMSMDLSLPSFFADCRGHVVDSDPMGMNMMIRCPKATAPAMTTSTNTSTPLSCSSLLSSSTKPSTAELQRRSSLPPPMPHRRKPSLHVELYDDKEECTFNDGKKEKDDDVQDQVDAEKAIQALWSSMPSLSHSSHNGGGSSSSNHDSFPPRQRDLRASWPSIRTGTENNKETVEQHQTRMPPTIPSRHRRQDSLLSTEANCGTMVPLSMQQHPAEPEQLSPTRRSSMPPQCPHRRKPSLTIEDLAAPTSPEKTNADYTARNPTAAMWASLPVLSSSENSNKGPVAKKRSSLVQPPSMPHRRKPSLTILEDGQEGMIEMWLSSHHNNSSQSFSDKNQHSVTSCSASGSDSVNKRFMIADTPPLSPGCVLLPSPIPSSSHHRRSDSLVSGCGDESVCSIVLKEGEVEI